MMVRATFTPQAESNELNVNIKTVSRPEESLFEIWGGVVWDRAMEEEYTIILTVYGVCCWTKQTHDMKGERNNAETHTSLFFSV